jgi:hypothetical protein
MTGIFKKPTFCGFALYLFALSHDKYFALLLAAMAPFNGLFLFSYDISI